MRARRLQPAAKKARKGVPDEDEEEDEEEVVGESPSPAKGRKLPMEGRKRKASTTRSTPRRATRGKPKYSEKDENEKEAVRSLSKSLHALVVPGLGPRHNPRPHS